jgi:alkylated DNA repair protein alkB family protein 1
MDWQTLQKRCQMPVQFMSIKISMVRRKVPNLILEFRVLILRIGLRLFPSLLPPECQVLLVDRLFHRELSNPLQKTNIHHDYRIPFPPPSPGSSHPGSFFTYPQSGKNQLFTPLNPYSNHKPINTAQFLQKKLRWLTIGDQYNWNTRAYPSSSPTPFPPDISALVTTLFQDAFTPESGVVLLYSPKDYMPVHRDVSEECQRGLASFSLGCDGLFVVARDKYPDSDESDDEREQEMLVIRVRSGDVVQMGGQTRWAWHAMPKVLAGTCPEWLQEWPVRGLEGEPKMYEKWRGYMRGKRLNISCRQVWS